MRTFVKIVAISMGLCVVLAVALVIFDSMSTDELVAHKLNLSIEECRRTFTLMQMSNNLGTVFTRRDLVSLCSMQVPKSLPRSEVIDYWVARRGY